MRYMTNFTLFNPKANIYMELKLHPDSTMYQIFAESYLAVDDFDSWDSKISCHIGVDGPFLSKGRPMAKDEVDGDYQLLAVVKTPELLKDVLNARHFQ